MSQPDQDDNAPQLAAGDGPPSSFVELGIVGEKRSIFVDARYQITVEDGDKADQCFIYTSGTRFRIAHPADFVLGEIDMARADLEHASPAGTVASALAAIQMSGLPPGDGTPWYPPGVRSEVAPFSMPPGGIGAGDKQKTE